MKVAYIILFLLIVSCTSLKNNSISTATKEKKTPATSKVIFLNYKISKNTSNTVELSLINKIISEGKLKKKYQNKTNYTIGDFICIQQDINSVAIDSIHIPNPLIKNIESSDVSGKLSRKKITLDNTTISTRMQLNSATKFIILKSVTNTNSSLLKIQL